MSTGLFLSPEALARISPALALRVAQPTSKPDALTWRKTTIVPRPLRHHSGNAVSQSVVCGSALVRQGGTSICAAVSLGQTDVSPRLDVSLLSSPVASPKLSHSTASASCRMTRDATGEAKGYLVEQMPTPGMQYFNAAKRLDRAIMDDTGMLAVAVSNIIASSPLMQQMALSFRADAPRDGSETAQPDLHLVLTVDITIMTYDGNIVDAAIMATYIALMQTHVPHFGLVAGQWRLVNPGTPHALGDVPLVSSVDSAPVLVSTSFLLLDQVGDEPHLIMDPTAVDEEVTAQRITVLFLATGSSPDLLCSVQHWGGGSMSSATEEQCIAAARKRTVALLEDIKAASLPPA